MFKATLRMGSLKTYGYNLSGFLEFCELYYIAPLEVSPLDLVLYITWFEDRGPLQLQA